MKRVFVLVNTSNERIKNGDVPVPEFDYWQQAENYRVAHCGNSPYVTIKRITTY